jgi:integrase
MSGEGVCAARFSVRVAGDPRRRAQGSALRGALRVCSSHSAGEIARTVDHDQYVDGQRGCRTAMRAVQSAAARDSPCRSTAEDSVHSVRSQPGLSNERRTRAYHRRTAARRRGPDALTGDDARIPRRTPPRNKGIRYPADPPRVEEIVAVMRHGGPGIHGARLRGLIVVPWRAGLRISEALGLAERDLDPGRGALLVRHGRGGERREVGMDEWG